MDNHDIYYYVINKFYSQFRYNRDPHKARIIPKKENIKIDNVYVRNTVFSNTNENTVKKMLVIHFRNSESESESESESKELIRLNVSYNDYIDRSIP
jgi:hypothetical protein